MGGPADRLRYKGSAAIRGFAAAQVAVAVALIMLLRTALVGLMLLGSVGGRGAVFGALALGARALHNLLKLVAAGVADASLAIIGALVGALKGAAQSAWNIGKGVFRGRGAVSVEMTAVRYGFQFACYPGATRTNPRPTIFQLSH
ncbi:hypothetical protein ASF28_11350 [Methylobacterium sp. Leaf99]|uniref:hypothetical protein n=1 Tax=Methylobacterium sp. Leaf99 TaxID=1736251 RepID=UPI0006FB0155|nr:hypothetical protein [Methylobacterium sp. Leaf99]KQP07715.1 hypothetical protein ASF28_11350 [Methylobacterium sp. Leaf99]